MRITSDMLISEVLRLHPETNAVFERHGLACPSCLGAGIETLDSVAHMHDVAIDVLLDELNGLNAEEGGSRP